MSERTHWDGCWRERTHHECAVARIAELEREIDAVRALMNTYNLGGWTDAVAPMRRALAAEAERDAALARADAMRAAVSEYLACEELARRDGCPTDRWDAACAAIDAARAEEQSR